MPKLNREYFRNFIFGAEDAFVSTVGVVFGLATNSDYSSKQLIVTGLVVISVEALSMSAGAFLSEESVHEIENSKNDVKDNTTVDALVMLVTYLLAGWLVLAPYLFIETTIAKYISMGVTFLALFGLGLIPVHKVKDGIRMVFIAGIAIIIGLLVANLIK
ncbi:VIT1/CCC1 transporter family protein [candidate division WWE3 bacterium]|nr:VIT1/CCC1 transporter family protein [candidate division WWE3 bacterium]